MTSRDQAEKMNVGRKDRKKKRRPNQTKGAKTKQGTAGILVMPKTCPPDENIIHGPRIKDERDPRFDTGSASEIYTATGERNEWPMDHKLKGVWVASAVRMFSP